MLEDFFVFYLAVVVVVRSSWLQTQRSRVRFPPLPDFLRSGGFVMGSTQPRELLEGKERLWSRKLRLTTVGDPPCSPHGTLYPLKLALDFADKWQSHSRYILYAD
jgi:hypothetical protein